MRLDEEDACDCDINALEKTVHELKKIPPGYNCSAGSENVHR